MGRRCLFCVCGPTIETRRCAFLSRTEKSNANPSRVGEVFVRFMIPGCRAKRALPWAIFFRAYGALLDALRATSINYPPATAGGTDLITEFTSCDYVAAYDLPFTIHHLPFTILIDSRFTIHESSDSRQHPRKLNQHQQHRRHLKHLRPRRHRVMAHRRDIVRAGQDEMIVTTKHQRPQH